MRAVWKVLPLLNLAEAHESWVRDSDPGGSGVSQVDSKVPSFRGWKRCVGWTVQNVTVLLPIEGQEVGYFDRGLQIRVINYIPL